MSNLLRLLSVSNLRHTLGIRVDCVALGDSQTLCLLNWQQSLLRQSDARMSLPRRRQSTRDPALLSSTDAKAMTKFLDAVFSRLVAREKSKSPGTWRSAHELVVVVVAMVVMVRVQQEQEQVAVEGPVMVEEEAAVEEANDEGSRGGNIGGGDGGSSGGESGVQEGVMVLVAAAVLSSIVLLCGCPNRTRY